MLRLLYGSRKPKIYNMEFNNDLELALEALKKGGIILYPTDTVWGIGCDATNDDAVKRLMQLKRRSDSKAMISLVDSIDTLSKWVDFIPTAALKEFESESLRPLTVIYDLPKGIASSLLAEDGSAAFRISGHEFSRELCRGLNSPVVSTSANISGRPTPLSFFDIDKELIDKVDYVCFTDREKKDSQPSRILKINNRNEIKVIRE